MSEEKTITVVEWEYDREGRVVKETVTVTNDKLLDHSTPKKEPPITLEQDAETTSWLATVEAQFGRGFENYTIPQVCQHMERQGDEQSSVQVAVNDGWYSVEVKQLR